MMLPSLQRRLAALRGPRALGVSLLAGLLPACAFAGPSIPTIRDELNATLTPDPFAAMPGDRISVEFPGNPEWNQEVRVRPDGTASFLFIGRHEVKGFSLEELEELLVEQYESTLQIADLTVDLRDVARRSVLVLGEMRSVGPVPFDERELSLVETLARAGGPNWQTALLKRTLLLRWFPAEKRRRAWVIDARIKHWGTPEQIWMQPDDILYVPPSPVVRLAAWIDQYIRRLLPFPYFLPQGVLF